MPTTYRTKQDAQRAIDEAIRAGRCTDGYVSVERLKSTCLYYAHVSRDFGHSTAGWCL